MAQNAFVLDLNISVANSITGALEVGWEYNSAFNEQRAIMWSSNPRTSSPIYLSGTSAGFFTSAANGSDGLHQVGDGQVNSSSTNALMWSGSSATQVNLHPTNLTGYSTSEAVAVSGTIQVGDASGAVTGNNAHAMLWKSAANTAVDLNPTNLSGFTTSFAKGTTATTQIGYGSGTGTSGNNHALLWSGKANTAVDLEPTALSAFTSSYGRAISGNQQVGYGSGPSFGSTSLGANNHALIWTGTAASAVDLHPTSGFVSSKAYATNGTQQAGYGLTSSLVYHALVWSGSANNYVDLYNLLPDSGGSVAESIDPWGNVSGYLVSTNTAACWLVGTLYRGPAGTSAWNGLNWSGNSSALPTSGDVLLVQEDSLTRNVTYSAVTSPAPTLGTVTIDALNSGSITLSQGQDVFNAGTEDVGYVGVGNYTQSGGKNNVTNLVLGAKAGSSGFYTLSGGTLTASNMQINAGTFLQIPGPFGGQNGGTFSAATLVTTGSLYQSGGTFSATTISNSGSFTASNASLGSVTGTGSLTILPASTAAANSISQNSLTINGTLKLNQNGSPSAVSVLNSLTVGASGKLDLNDNDLILNYTTTSPAQTVRSLLAQGYNNGLWTGNGITSSAAANNSSHTTALGYAEASDLGLAHGRSFDATTIANQAIIIKYTYFGDQNLDGKVNLDDFSIFIDGFNGLGSGWIYGDFNYDGMIDQKDFALFVQGFNLNGQPLSELRDSVISDPSLSASQRAAMLSAVPEPSFASVLALGATFFFSRRRFRTENSQHSQK